MHRQREAGVELEHVVRDARRDVADASERAPSLLLHRRGRRAGRRSSESSSGRRAARARDRRASAPRATRRSSRITGRPPARFDATTRASSPPTKSTAPTAKRARILARLLDEERAVEPVRPADPADRRRVPAARYSAISSSTRRSSRAAPRARRAQRACDHPPAAADHLAAIGLGDVQPQDEGRRPTRPPRPAPRPGSSTSCCAR